MAAVTLTHQDFSLLLAPDLGGAILEFSHHGQPIFRPSTYDAVARDVLMAACFPCVPYFGRLYNGLTFNGQCWAQDLTHPAINMAAHGEGWITPWEIETQTTTSLTCAFHHKADIKGRFPFPFKARQSFLLNDDGLTTTLSLSNSGTQTMPAGLALHPYFQRTETSEISFRASKYYSPPLAIEPSTVRAASTNDLPDMIGTGAFATLPKDHRDHTYLGFKGDVQIRTGGSAPEFILRTSAPAVHVYAPAGENYYCLEPITQAPGALTKEDLTKVSNNPALAKELARLNIPPRILSPGEEMKIDLAITLIAY